MAFAVMIAGAAISAYSAYSQQQQAAKMDDLNQQIALQESEQKKQVAMGDTLNLSKERRRTIGTQLTMFGAAGVDPGVGSPLDVMASTAAEYERDIRYKGYAGDIGSVASANEANLYAFSAGSRRRASYLSAASSILSSAGKMYGGGGYGGGGYGSGGAV